LLFSLSIRLFSLLLTLFLLSFSHHTHLLLSLLFSPPLLSSLSYFFSPLSPISPLLSSPLSLISSLLSSLSYFFCFLSSPLLSLLLSSLSSLFSPHLLSSD